ncbi:MAG: NAD(P)-dependent oxidoreductase [Microvirga sp.]
MRILVTGAAGFVGSHLLRGLANAYPEAELIAADLVPPADGEAVFQDPRGGRITFHHLDIADRIAVADCIRQEEPTHVVHAAAVTPTAAQERDEPQRIVDVNVGGTLAVLDAATRMPGIRRIVTVSSGAVFGRAQTLPDPVDEDVPAVPDMLYGITKLASEGLTSRLGALRGISTASVRLGSVYGDLERATSTRHRTSLVHRLARATVPMTVSSGDVVRDWVHADDVAAAVAGLLAERPLRWDLYHVGGGEAVGWRRIVAIFRRAGRPVSWADAGATADIAVGAQDARPVFSIDRIRAETAFRPRSIEEGVTGLIEQTKVSA